MAESDELDRQRLVGGGADATERAAEAALRPKRLEDFTGQEVVRGQLSVVLRSALARGVTADHVLLSGPPGLGKTTLAMIIAAEVDGSLRLTSGPAIQHAGDLAAILSSLEEGDVLFIDEIHRLARTAEEMLYLAMEDFRVDIVVGKGPGATSIPLSLPPFTVVGATTRAGLLPAPLRDRFGFTGHLDYYDPAELARILARSAGLLGVSLDADAAAELASRSRGTPRIANRLLRRVQDWAEVHGTPGRLDLQAARGALEVFEVDALGLDTASKVMRTATMRESQEAIIGRVRRRQHLISQATTEGGAVLLLSLPSSSLGGVRMVLELVNMIEDEAEWEDVRKTQWFMFSGQDSDLKLMLRCHWDNDRWDEALSLFLYLFDEPPLREAFKVLKAFTPEGSDFTPEQLLACALFAAQGMGESRTLALGFYDMPILDD